MPAADIIHALTSTGSTPADIVGALLQYGLIGLFLLDALWTHKLITPRWVMDEKDARIAKLEGTLEKLTDLTNSEIVPALTRATEVNKDYLDLLSERRHGRRG